MTILAVGLALMGAGSAPAAGTASFRVGDPSWSPDGAKIAFDGSLEGNAADIYTISSDGTGLRNLTPDDPEVNVLPSWGRRIGHIAYETDLGNPQVAKVRYSLVAPDGSGRRELAVSTAIGPITWSADDRYIAFDGRFNAVTVPLVSRGIVRPRLIALGLSGPWAPRVLRLALGVEKADGVHLATASHDGTARRRLTRGHESVRSLAWSRDGRWMLFTGSRGGMSGFNLYVIAVTTGRVVRLASAARTGDFSLDGRRVVYSPESGGVYTVSLDGRGRRRLSTYGSNPRWSPDGRWIVFEADARIELVQPNGTNRRLLVGS